MSRLAGSTPPGVRGKVLDLPRSTASLWLRSGGERMQVNIPKRVVEICNNGRTLGDNGPWMRRFLLQAMHDVQDVTDITTPEEQGPDWDDPVAVEFSIHGDFYRFIEQHIPGDTMARRIRSLVAHGLWFADSRGEAKDLAWLEGDEAASSIGVAEHG